MGYNAPEQADSLLQDDLDIIAEAKDGNDTRPRIVYYLG